MLKKRLLGAYAGKEDLKIDDLVDLAARLIPPLAGPQTRYKVTDIPDARTVRYYVSEGLVDPPLGTAGASALYGYKHLLQLVLLKVMQARHSPIRMIRETMSRADIKSLENMLERLLIEDHDAVKPGPARGAAMSESAHDYLKALVDQPGGKPAPSSWERHELYPGVELHVRRDVVLPTNPSFLSALASRMRAILDRLRRSTP